MSSRPGVKTDQVLQHFLAQMTAAAKIALGEAVHIDSRILALAESARGILEFGGHQQPMEKIDKMTNMVVDSCNDVEAVKEMVPKPSSTPNPVLQILDGRELQRISDGNVRAEREADQVEIFGTKRRNEEGHGAGHTKRRSVDDGGLGRVDKGGVAMNGVPTHHNNLPPMRPYSP